MLAKIYYIFRELITLSIAVCRLNVGHIFIGLDAIPFTNSFLSRILAANICSLFKHLVIVIFGSISKLLCVSALYTVAYSSPLHCTNFMFEFESNFVEMFPIQTASVNCQMLKMASRYSVNGDLRKINDDIY